MELKFKEQQYQIDAVNALVRCFSGQPKGSLLGDVLYKQRIDYGVAGFADEEFNAFANSPIDPEVRYHMLSQVQELQKEQGIPVVKSLEEGKNGEVNFTVEMETGTGKTYVYTRSILELNRQYGWSKFIIMVPSIAIREGVYKSLSITANHFQDIYGKKIRFFIYDTKNSSNLSNIKNFAESSSIEVMVMNYQAFGTNSEESRKIYQKMDSTNSIRPIDIIAGTKPILIIDEPQKFGITAEAKMQDFKPLFIVRYSATHRKDYNKIYRLDAVDAMNQRLVKKIKVKGIETIGGTGTNSYMFLDRINVSTTKYPTATIRMEIESKGTGGIKKVPKDLEEGADLYEISNGMAQYKHFVINKIDAYHNVVTFVNGVEIKVGQVLGNIDEEHVRRIQIRETILQHLEKERLMFQKGIKVLSLFFIDEVKKYRDYDKEDEKGDYAHMFEEEYQNAINEKMTSMDDEYIAYLQKFSSDQIHKGYFSIDKKGRFIDSKETKEGGSDDVSAYDLIMKNKEKLLDLNEPTRFIFSHSALREGWDNPNIFQICTLKEASSEISKRQEIGRGLRICVDKNGYRQDAMTLGGEFFDVNTLTVIASESYDAFAKALQKEVLESLSDRPTKITAKVLSGRILKNENGETFEIGEETALDIIMDMKIKGYLDKDYNITDLLIKDIDEGNFESIDELSDFKDELSAIIYKVHTTANFKVTENASSNMPSTLYVKDENFEKFKVLWNKIKFKTTYKVEFDSEELIKNSIKSIDDHLKIKKITIKVTTGSLTEHLNDEKLKEGTAMSKDEQQFIDTASALGNIKYDLIGEIAKSTNLTRKTVTKILKGIKKDKFEQFYINPEDFIHQISELINNEKAATLISNITYFKTNDEFDENELFTINNFSGNLQENIMEVKKHIYDYLKVDSNNERKFAEELETGEVSVYAKLPRGFVIPTPVGNYNPDWAIVFDKENVKYIYFIAETKGSLSTMQLRQSERLKIDYARKHFEALNNTDVKYDVVESYEDLMTKIF